MKHVNPRRALQGTIAKLVETDDIRAFEPYVRPHPGLRGLSKAAMPAGNR